MAWFGQHNDVDNVEEFERKAIEKTMLREQDTPGASISTMFAHIFAGGYSAGYYSYKWAEVLMQMLLKSFKRMESLTKIQLNRLEIIFFHRVILVTP